MPQLLAERYSIKKRSHEQVVATFFNARCESGQVY